MRKTILLFLFLLLFISNQNIILAQTISSGNFLIAQPIPDRTVLYNLSNAGIAKPITWGLDMAWLDDTNLKRGIAFMGLNNVDIIRSSFTPTDSLINGDLKPAELSKLNQRLSAMNVLSPNTKVVLNCDHPSVSSWYIGKPARWAQLIDVTTRRHQEKGRTVVSVSPFNEPDFGWGQFSGSNGMIDFYNIAVELRKNSRFDNIRISGGNTLNTDQALPWYNYLKTQINEGNTHQLAGSFDNFASFYTTVKANGHIATGDECHNVIEPMVGAEYGLNTAIWWGTAELARGEFVKASDGVRLGYAEHRTNWTAASVYKHAEGKVQAFGGTSERQALTTTYRFVSKERDVYYDGNGPQREYTMVLPGGTGYQTGQTGAERVVNITWGEDVQPVINGKYILVNRNSGKVIEVPGGSTTSGTYLRQNTSIPGATYQQWNITPVDSRIGGDFSYFFIKAAHSGKAVDVYNWSFNDNGYIDAWDSSNATIQQWYLEYAEDGYFFIRSRYNNKCLDVLNSSLTANYIVQKEKTSNYSQQWRLIPATSQVEFTAPSTPENLIATSNATSVQLDWNTNTESDLAGYNIYRSETSGSAYNTIARNVKSNSFVDNATLAGKQYFYTIKAVDNSLNRSAYSNEVTATATGNQDLVTHLQFNGNSMDTTLNLNHSSIYGNSSYVAGKVGSNAILLSGTNNYIQLPATVANHNEITIATWVYWLGSSSWQRIFDVGNGESENMYLTPKSGIGFLRFGIKNNGTEQGLNATALPLRMWTHIAITMGATEVKMYVNGNVVAQSTSITISPNDFKPVLNYIGRSQYASDPLFSGYIDDFRVYNYTLSATDVSKLASGTPDGVTRIDYSSEVTIFPTPAKNVLHINFTCMGNNTSSSVEILSIDGRKLMNENIQNTSETELNVSKLSSGMYLLKITNDNKTAVKKFIVKH